ncbi:MAG: hypothetical protein ACR2GY_13255 [Phycisphaerales bacterium]
MNGRRFTLGLLVIVLIILGLTLYLSSDWTLLGGIVTMTGVLLAVIGVFVIRRGDRPRLNEPERIEQLDAQRTAMLIRGTSMHLRDMNYSYSIRPDHGTTRVAFTAEVNTILLGFLPVILMENQTERQGEGFVAFPYDGERWRGPGLPCAGEPDEAIAHAARCVAPLGEE